MSIAEFFNGSTKVTVTKHRDGTQTVQATTYQSREVGLAIVERVTSTLDESLRLDNAQRRVDIARQVLQLQREFPNATPADIQRLLIGNK